MHYGDKKQLKSCKLTIVVYKHQILGSTMKRNKNGAISKRCVDYEIASIQNCKHFSPRSLKKILSDPYKYFALALDKIEFETWTLVSIFDTDGYGDFRVIPTYDVSYHRNELLRLH